MAASTIVALKSSPEAQVTLVWLPHAGGSAAYFQELSNALPDEVEGLAVEYPGRGRRWREPLCPDLMRIAEEVAVSLSTQVTKPYVLFGHSMGALVAFEACRLLRLRGSECLPKLIIVSSCEPPHLRSDSAPLRGLPDADLIDAILAMDGTAARGATAEELLQLTLPVFRSDLNACELHRFVPSSRLRENLLIYVGETDEFLRRELLHRWAHLTDGHANLRTFEGGHFYMLEKRSEFIAQLSEDVIAAPLPCFGAKELRRGQL